MRLGELLLGFGRGDGHDAQRAGGGGRADGQGVSGCAGAGGSFMLFLSFFVAATYSVHAEEKGLAKPALVCPRQLLRTTIARARH